jgi:hypothetical protein
MACGQNRYAVLAGMALLTPKARASLEARRHHASALERTADHDRFAAQLWMIALLD